ncbi:MAG: hypothetical protein GY719_26050 [bacterium]|nr:hypothetical protein [bacterium]
MSELAAKLARQVAAEVLREQAEHVPWLPGWQERGGVAGTDDPLTPEAKAVEGALELEVGEELRRMAGKMEK